MVTRVSEQMNTFYRFFVHVGEKSGVLQNGDKTRHFMAQRPNYP